MAAGADVQDDSDDTNSEEDTLRQFFGKKEEYYLQKHRMFETLGGKFSWNWAAFLLGPLWFAYRKIWNIAVFLSIASISTELIKAEALENSLIQYIDIIIGLVIMFISGAYGNYFYINHAKRKLFHITQKTNEREITIGIMKSGGVTIIGPILLFLIIFSVIFLMAAALDQDF